MGGDAPNVRVALTQNGRFRKVPTHVQQFPLGSNPTGLIELKSLMEECGYYSGLEPSLRPVGARLIAFCLVLVEQRDALASSAGYVNPFTGEALGPIPEQQSSARVLE